MNYISQYCPLCGAHKFEWYEGEASDETLMEYEEEIKKLLAKIKGLKEKEVK